MSYVREITFKPFIKSATVVIFANDHHLHCTHVNTTLARNIPVSKPIMPSSTDPAIYMTARTSSPRVHKFTTSNEKVEKVVKAPSSPTTRNARISADGDQTKAEASIRTPSVKEPSELTIMVPNGNQSPKKCPAPEDKRNRLTAPTAPPAAPTKIV